MDGDDDICVLPDSSEDEVEAYPHPIQCVIPFSPLSPVPDFDRGSHHALQKAYADVKRRLNESNTKNQLLARRVRELETTKNSYTGDSYDMMDDVSSRGQGAAEAQMAAEEGYSNNLQRQLTRARSQIQAVEKKYQETVQEMNSKLDTLSQQLQEALAQVASLSQEKLQLQQGYQAARREREVAVQAVQELEWKCESLEIEKDKVMKEGASLHLLLQKAEQEVALLKEKQEDSLSSEPPAELVAELANMRKIIDSLKKMVLVQRDFLARRGMSMSMQSSLSRSVRDLPSAEPTTTPPSSGRSGGSHSGQSWEMVNGISALTLDPRQQQQQMMVQQQSVTLTSSKLSPLSDYQEAVTNPAAAHKPMVSGDGSVARMSPSVASHVGPAVSGQKSKTEIIQRRRSEDSVAQPRSRTEMIRVPQSPRLAEHMDSHYQQLQQQVSGGMATQLGPTGLIQLQQGSVGLNQLQQEVSRPGPSELVQGVTSQPRAPHHLGVQYPLAPYSSQRQTSPAREPPSTYDNLTLGNGNHVGTVPPAPLVNGARFVLNSADSFGSSGGSTMTLAPQQPGLAVAMRRDGAARGSPQEHTDFTQPLDHAHPDLTHQLQDPAQFENAQPAGEAAAPNLDRKCPVCGQDFSHISMDEFQTHVFECFDDAEEANAPETLQPQNSTKQSSGSANRICPMCEKQFPENVTQQFFEGHVQSHFEEIDPFEVLHPPQA